MKEIQREEETFGKVKWWRNSLFSLRNKWKMESLIVAANIIKAALSNFFHINIELDGSTAYFRHFFSSFSCFAGPKDGPASTILKGIQSHRSWVTQRNSFGTLLMTYFDVVYEDGADPRTAYDRCTHIGKRKHRHLLTTQPNQTPPQAVRSPREERQSN